jgi:hypothetical protein
MEEGFNFKSIDQENHKKDVEKLRIKIRDIRAFKLLLEREKENNNYYHHLHLKNNDDVEEKKLNIANCID